MTGKQPGVLLVNLGTPSAPTAPAIRAFLREFLLDRAVVKIPRLIWWPLLFGVILPFRPRKLVHKYQSVWTPEGSPLLAISRQQRTALQAALPDCRVALAMRYGEPAIAQGLRELAGADPLILLPLYPQYSGTTTGTTFSALERLRPGFKGITDYHADPAYIAALAQSVRAHWSAHGRGEKLLMSFHGLPQRFVDEGDPYARQCETTARLLADALQLQPREWQRSYQSRLGRAQWLQPYTEATVRSLAQQDVKSLDVICPGFAADCLETLEEIALQTRDAFISAGGKQLRYIPALNDQPAHIAALAALIQRELHKRN